MLVATLLTFAKPEATASETADGSIAFSTPEFEQLCVELARLPGMGHPRLRRPLTPRDGAEFLRALPGAVYGRYANRRVALAWHRTAPTPEDRRLDAIVEHLWARRTPAGQAEETFPDEPGLYAIWADPDGLQQLHRALPTISTDPARPIYVGKSESSLLKRDARGHFRAGQTGRSTLRRSIAALLHRLDETGPLHARPRNPQNPERFDKFGLDDASEQVLQEWIEQHLSIAWWTPLDETTPQPVVSLETLERALIGHPLWCAPPALNLKDLGGRPTATARPIKAARDVLKKDAEARATGRKVPDITPRRQPAPEPKDEGPPNPEDPRRIWLDGGRNPSHDATGLVAVDDRLAAATTAAPTESDAERNDDAVRAFRRGDRTILLCLDGRRGPTAAKVAASTLDLELSTSTIALEDTDGLIALLCRANDAARIESARAGHPDSHSALALAIVQDRTVRWATIGPALIAVVDPDATVRRLGTPQDQYLGRPADLEFENAVETGTTVLWPGGWLLLTSETYTSSTDWDATVLESAIVRTHYPAQDPRRGMAIPTAAAVAQDLVDGAHAAAPTATASAIVLRRKTFSDLAPPQREAELQAWWALGRI